MAYGQDDQRATSAIVRKFSAVDSVTALMVRDEDGKFLGTLSVRMLRALLPTPWANRTMVVRLSDVEETTW